MSAPLLKVSNLQTEFKTPGGTVRAVRGLSFQVERGETVGIVGESGSGKSVTALSLMGLIPNPPGKITGGSIQLDGQELVGLPQKDLNSLRGSKIAMVFQDPFSSLNPTMTLGEQVAEPIRLHTGASRAEAKERAIKLFQAVRIPEPETRYKQYPHQVSGGQRQRVMIAIAFACNPQLLIADEPTTALDVTVQAQVLTLMHDMQRQNNCGVLIITHDFGVVAEICDRVLVMYAGALVESGPVNEIFHNPRHPYTKGLLESLPRVEEQRVKRLPSIPGQPPDLSRLGVGCPFMSRCKSAVVGVCDKSEPEVSEVNSLHTVRCHLNTGPQ